MKKEEKLEFRTRLAILTVSLVFMFPVFAFAATDTSALDNIIHTFCDWAFKIGLFVALIGGIDFAIGFKGNDADEKIRGMKTCAAGLIASGIAHTPSLFGLN